MDDVDEMIKEKWRNLGFYYDLDENAKIKEWKFFGSKVGLFNFVRILGKYTANEANDTLSEHDHYGPYNYLKILTWDIPEISEYGIAGTIENLTDLREMIATKLNMSETGESFSIDSEYGINNTATAKFFVMADDFDPVSMDGNYNK